MQHDAIALELWLNMQKLGLSMSRRHAIALLMFIKACPNLDPKPWLDELIGSEARWIHILILSGGLEG